MKVNSTWKRSSKFFFFFLPPLFVFSPETSFVKFARILSLTLSPVKPFYLLFHVIQRSCRSPASTSITKASLLLILFLLISPFRHLHVSFFFFFSHGSAAAAVHNKTKIRRGFSCFVGRLVDLRRHLRWANQSNWPSYISYSIQTFYSFIFFFTPTLRKLYCAADLHVSRVKRAGQRCSFSRFLPSRKEGKIGSKLLFPV